MDHPVTRTQANHAWRADWIGAPNRGKSSKFRLMKISSLTSLPAHPKTYYRKAAVNGLDIFYREAGSLEQPTVVLLHGFPSSSHMFRELIPMLAENYHVIAPDYPGFGQSSMPDAEAFAYTFDHLAEVMEKFLDQIGCRRFALYMQDYGSPVGFRLAVKHPEWISALVIQNANAYVEGINLEAFLPVQPFWAKRTPETEAPVRGFLAEATTRFQYTHGTRDPAAINPDTWLHDQTLLDRPGNDQIQLALLHDYQNNVPLYEVWQKYLRENQPPTLIVWGKNDPFFTEAGARAYLKDVPNAELRLFETGHFALEEDGGVIATEILRFLGRLMR
jgi:pimeloyl-ACP methyl ester carboxylesterase